LSSHQCVRPTSENDTEPWRCPDCGMLWEPLPAQPVNDPSQPRRSWSETFGAVAGVAQCVGMLALFWTLGLRTIFYGMCLCILLSVAGLWVWRRLSR
jgi:hypothetical protein